MARRTASVLAPLAAGLLLAVAAPGTAHAADGVLIINGLRHVDPHVCIPLEGKAEQIINGTGTAAYLYEKAGCTGRVTETVSSGEEVSNDQARSLWIG